MPQLKELLNTKKEVSIVKLFVIAVVVIAVIIGGIYLYQKQNNPVNKQVSQVSDVLSKVGALMDLPKDETPTIAKITEVEKLKSEPIFAKAENGDYVLIYNKAGKIIIYRPFTNRIIETAALSSLKSSSVNQQPTKAPVSLDNLTVTLYNAGATGSALLDNAEKKLKDAYPKIKIVGREESSQKSYAKNLIVDVKGNKNNEVQLLLELFNADTSSLPEGENTPASDLLIIVVK